MAIASFNFYQLITPTTSTCDLISIFHLILFSWLPERALPAGDWFKRKIAHHKISWARISGKTLNFATLIKMFSGSIHWSDAAAHLSFTVMPRINSKSYRRWPLWIHRAQRRKNRKKSKLSSCGNTDSTQSLKGDAFLTLILIYWLATPLSSVDKRKLINGRCLRSAIRWKWIQSGAFRNSLFSYHVNICLDAILIKLKFGGHRVHAVNSFAVICSIVSIDVFSSSCFANKCRSINVGP